MLQPLFPMGPQYHEVCLDLCRDLVNGREDTPFHRHGVDFDLVLLGVVLFVFLQPPIDIVDADVFLLQSRPGLFVDDVQDADFVAQEFCQFYAV